MQNPYITAHPARGDDFVGRVRLLNRIKKFIESNEQQNFLVLGKRRSGKTSLLKKIQDTHSSNKIIVCYVNLQKYLDAPLNKVLSEVKSQIIEHLVNQSIQTKKQDFEALIKKVSKRRQIIILFDEFDVMCGREEIDKQGMATVELARYWQELCEFAKAHKISIKTIFASSHYCLFEESPTCYKLFKSCKIAKLTALNKSAVYRILGMGDLQFQSDEVLDEFYKLTAGNPFFTQVLAHTLFEVKSVKAGTQIGLTQLWKSMHVALKRHGYGASVIWGELNPVEQKILLVISSMSRKNINPDFGQILNKLEEQKFSIEERELQKNINKLKADKFIKIDDDKKHSFASSFFQEWVIRFVRK